jgi:hypothetical protein
VALKLDGNRLQLLPHHFGRNFYLQHPATVLRQCHPSLSIMFYLFAEIEMGPEAFLA